MNRILILLLIATTSWHCSRPHRETTATSLIPNDAAVVLKINDLDGFLRESGSEDRWGIADSILRLAWEDDGLSALVNELDTSSSHPFAGYLSWHSAGASKFEFLVCTQSSGGSWEAWKREKSYEDQIIYQSTDPSGWFAVVIDGRVALSPSLLLVERCILQHSKNTSLAQSEAFANLEKTSTASDPANLFIQWDEATEWLKQVNSSHLLKLNPLAGGWTELDVSRGAYTLLTGITQKIDSIPNALDAFSSNASRMSNFESYLPNNTSFYTALHFENFETYRREYYKYLKHTHRETVYERVAAQPLLVDGLCGWIDQAMILFYLDLPQGDFDRRANALIRSRDRALAEELLKTVQKTERYDPIGDYSIQKINVNALSTVLGSLFHDLSEPYFTFVDDWVLFSEDLSDMRNILNAIRSKRVLQTTPSYMEHRDRLQDRSHVLAYADIKRCNEAFAPLWKSGFPGWTAGWGKAFLQAEVNEGLIHTHVLLTSPAMEREEVTSYFTTALDTAISWGPQPFKSHVSPEREILVQDAKNQLYLISSKGTILWKKMLDGPILGEVHQVDAYKNEKWQFAFNTPRSVYFVDRNGVDIGAFPLHIESGMEAPIAVLDYDNNRNYRILVSTANRIDNYTFDGAIVGGWNATFPGDAVAQQPQLVQVGGKDYIFVQTRNQQVFALNRRGDKRLTFPVDTALAEGPFFLYHGGNDPLIRVVKANRSGYLNHYFLDEISDKLPVEGLDSGHQFTVLDDHLGYYANGTLRVQGPDYRWEKSFESGDFWKGYKFQVGPYWGITDTLAQEVWVFQPDAEEVDGFPVRGDLEGFLAPLLGDGSLFLITGEREGFVHVYATPL